MSIDSVSAYSLTYMQFSVTASASPTASTVINAPTAAASVGQIRGTGDGDGDDAHEAAGHDHEGGHGGGMSALVDSLFKALSQLGLGAPGTAPTAPSSGSASSAPVAGTTGAPAAAGDATAASVANPVAGTAAAPSQDSAGSAASALKDALHTFLHDLFHAIRSAQGGSGGDSDGDHDGSGRGQGAAAYGQSFATGLQNLIQNLGGGTAASAASAAGTSTAPATYAVPTTDTAAGNSSAGALSPTAKLQSDFKALVDALNPQKSDLTSASNAPTLLSFLQTLVANLAPQPAQNSASSFSQPGSLLSVTA